MIYVGEFDETLAQFNLRTGVSLLPSCQTFFLGRLRVHELSIQCSLISSVSVEQYAGDGSGEISFPKGKGLQQIAIGSSTLGGVDFAISQIIVGRYETGKRFEINPTIPKIAKHFILYWSARTEDAGQGNIYTPSLQFQANIEI